MLPCFVVHFLLTEERAGKACKNFWSPLSRWALPRRSNLNQTTQAILRQLWPPRLLAAAHFACHNHLPWLVSSSGGYVRRAVASFLGLLLALNALWMLAAPANWYGRIPGVADTGPANLHFIRDIGAAYLVAAAGLIWLAVDPARARAAAMTSAIFLGLHALVHVWDATAGRETSHALLRDLPAIMLPAILALWLAWPAPDLRKG
jgi:hypothetical protein